MENKVYRGHLFCCMLDAKPTNAGHSVTASTTSWTPQPSASAQAAGTATAWVYEFPMFPIIQS